MAQNTRAIILDDEDPHDHLFYEVHNFLRSYTLSPSLPNAATTLPASISFGFDPSKFDPTSSASSSLGDLTRLFQFCGIPLDPPHSQHQSKISSSFSAPSNVFSTSSCTTPDNGPCEIVDESERTQGGEETADADYLLDFVNKVNEVCWKVEAAKSKPSASVPRRKGKKASFKEKVAEFDSVEFTRLLDDVSDNGLKAVAKRTRTKGSSRSLNNNTESLQKPGESTRPGPLPSLVTPPSSEKSDTPLLQPPKCSAYPFSYLSTGVLPIYTLTITEKKHRLSKKLLKKNLLSPHLNLTEAISKWGGNSGVNGSGIHVFVDLSNIMIGFYQKLKIDRNLSFSLYVKPAPISFHSLAFVMERGRTVARRVIAGSHNEYIRSQKNLRPQHMIEAEQCGYEMNILEPVVKARVETPARKLGGKGNGYLTGSGHSDASLPIQLTRMEQCVDEILQMKMLESIVDTAKPSTMILASGDAAEAEYSGGFLKMVVRALQKGWKVELFAWSHSLSKEYQTQEFLDKWYGKFIIIELDDFSEELLAMYSTPYFVPPGM